LPLNLYSSFILLDPDIVSMTDVAKKVKNAEQDAEAKIQTEKDHAEGKPSSETLNKAKSLSENSCSSVSDPGTSIM
jgi:vacuolar-type H+-ATPase subunit H